MSQTVEEGDLDFRHFRCCGDEDLYPFGCPRCGRLMVFCYECDTLHGDLHDLDHAGRWTVNNYDPASPIFVCPQCAYPFEYFFIRDGKYKTSFDRSPPRNEETVITYGLGRFRQTWVIATWSQGWPRFGSADKLQEAPTWRDGWNLAE